MKKYHATIWLGVLLVIAGAIRLVAPFSTTIGTITTACGNAVAYLDGQDKGSAFSVVLTACGKNLRLASHEGGAGVAVGVILFITGIVLYRRHRQVRAPRDAMRQAQGSPSFAGSASAMNRDVANPEMFEQFMRLGRLTRPRTVLSFFSAVFVALIAGSIVAISLFLKHPDLTKYIVWILVFDAVTALALIIGVFVTITKDPARLMLSEITSQNAVALRSGGRRKDDPPPEAASRRVVPDVEMAPLRRRRDDPQD